MPVNFALPLGLTRLCHIVNAYKTCHKRGCASDSDGMSLAAASLWAPGGKAGRKNRAED